MESLAPALVDGMETLLDVLPAGRRRRRCCDPERVRTRAHDLVATSAGVPRRQLGQRRRRQRRAGRPRRRSSAARRTGRLAEVRGHALADRPRRGGRSPRSPATTSCVTDGDDDVGERLALDTADAEAYRGDTAEAVADLRRLGRATAGGRSSSPRATAWPSASSRCSPSTTCPAGWTTARSSARAGRRARHHRLGRAAGSSPPRRGWPSSPRPTSPAAPAGPVHQGHAPDAVAAAQRGRPAAAAPRRLRRARAARRRPVRRDDAAHRRRRHPRVPRHRVRPEQARPAGRPALRADRPARPGHPLRRRRGARP